jgi:lysophospholipase L1-like esterase
MTTGIDATDSLGWLGHLEALLEAMPGYAASETTDDLAGSIDATLAGMSGTPTYVFINTGANDVEVATWAGITENSWKTDMSYIISAIHTKWSAAKIYISLSYRYSVTDDYNDEHTTLSTWAADLAALNPSYVFVGPNEQPILDSHPELLGDGLHPNHDGCIAIAQAAKTTLGF